MYTKLLTFIIIALALITMPGTTQAQGGAIPQALSSEAIPCPMPLYGEVEGETIECGQITVPTVWDDLSSDPLTITYARLFSYSKSPIADPIIYFVGGPGGSVRSPAARHPRDVRVLPKSRDFH